MENRTPKKMNTNLNNSNLNNNNNLNKIDLCPCGDPLNHKNSCSLYCGMYPCEDDMVKLPQCQHFMHQQCLEQLLYTRMSSCPLCRSSINSLRTHKHYQVIEKEIRARFQSDTDRAIRLSLQLLQSQSQSQSQTSSPSVQS